jgi:hypothetical protein
MIDLIQLLNECADALLVPTWDHENREEHLTLIEAALAKNTTPDVIRELLGSAATICRSAGVLFLNLACCHAMGRIGSD